MWTVAGCIVFVVLVSADPGRLAAEEAQGEAFLEEYDAASAAARRRNIEAAWTYNTNITRGNQDKMIEEQLTYSHFVLEWAKNASRFAWHEFQNQTTKRQFSKITNIGTAAMEDPVKLQRLQQVVANMKTVYNTGEVCTPNGECLDLDPGLVRLMATSRDYDELLRAWQGWRDVSGKLMKDDYVEFVTLSNEAINMSGYRDTGEYWKSMYESDSFAQDVEQLFLQMEPFYQQLHAYTKTKLKQVYGADRFPSSGHIPAHILGNMWAQSWSNLQDILEPYPGKGSMDVTGELVKQNYTAVKMFELSDDFFRSLGMETMPPKFWSLSMLEKPTDGRDVVCHASAWDFYTGDDFRIKQCTDITHSDLVTVHHEMGHVEYYLQYKHQPVVFRRGANPGFHEGVADVVSLSLQTPQHLRKIGLLHSQVDDEESEINFLMAMALRKIAFLPFGYLIDQWRWNVFSGETQPADYNSKWWDLRCRYQGISPPVSRSSSDFDPGAKFHIPANVPYIRYFVSSIIQFQFHKKLCDVSGHVGPLHKCDIYNSTAAGQLFSAMLKLGSSKPWPEVMRVMTGQDKMDAQPLVDYFQPLKAWLIKQNEGSDVKWTHECPKTVHTSSGRSIYRSHVTILIKILLIFWFVNL